MNLKRLHVIQALFNAHPFTFGIGLALLAGWLQGAGAQTTLRDKARVDAEHRILNAIASVAEKSHRAVIVEYETSGQFMTPDVIHIDAAKGGADALATLKAMFYPDNRFDVHADQDGAVVVVQRGLAQDVLRLRIKEVVLSEKQQFNPDLAMNALLHSPEITAYFKAHRIKLPIDMGGLVAGPQTNLPHLEPAIVGPTILDALKHIVTVFHCTGIYKEQAHKGHRIVSIGFVNAE
jgi:hypothetical protein